jgi:anionic cell wall polymer biosynthesis LytR-Cps2A-Psr (LCP) family protein
MDRQRCALSAILTAANPTKVLTSYQEIASTAEATLKTDIPQAALQGFVDLGFKAKKAAVRSVVFDQNVINPAYPDFAKIRSLVQQTLSGEAAPTSAPPAAPSSVTPTGSPNLNGPPAVSDVSNACAYDSAEANAALAQGKPPSKAG